MIETFLGLPRKSSEIFGFFQKMFSNVHVTVGQVLQNLWKSSENVWKSSENRQKCSYQYVYTSNNQRLGREFNTVTVIP